MLAGLSTSHKLGLGIAGAIFIAFALTSSFLLPRWRPDYPGRRLGAFVFVSLVLFGGMLTSVAFFGQESEEGKAEARKAETSAAPAKSAPTTAAGRPRTLAVTEKEWAVELPQKSLRAGSYTIRLVNKGKMSHNLTISGPGVSNAATPTIAPGKTATLKVTLRKGQYDFFCSVPGHKQLGMDAKVTVTAKATATAPATTSASKAASSLIVTEKEWKVEVPQPTLKPGSYTITLDNKGQAGHDLTIDGPGVAKAHTPVIPGGKTAKLKVTLKKGSYDFYCSVPGHKQLGMDTKVKVT